MRHLRVFIRRLNHLKLRWIFWYFCFGAFCANIVLSSKCKSNFIWDTLFKVFKPKSLWILKFYIIQTGLCAKTWCPPWAVLLYSLKSEGTIGPLVPKVFLIIYTYLTTSLLYIEDIFSLLKHHCPSQWQRFTYIYLKDMETEKE